MPPATASIPRLAEPPRTTPRPEPAPSRPTLARRHDVDGLRVYALGLLIVYHIAISFQPWAYTIFFPQNREPLLSLWPVMSMVNVWRIPILFLVSGMGVRFAMERRNLKQLLADRTLRILLPLVFGFFAICPISVFFEQRFYGKELAYLPNAGHLWFLGNIFLYVLLLLPLLAYFKRHPDGVVLRTLRSLLRHPLALPLVAVPLMVEAWLVDPRFFTLYALTAHGFWLGLICFLTGFLFIAVGADFWPAVERSRIPALVVAAGLYLARMLLLGPTEIGVLLALESMAWMLSLLGFGSKYLNRPMRGLAYLSKAVYPVYILHMPVQFGLSLWILPMDLPAPLELLLLLGGTFTICLALYELVLRRVRGFRPLFGMKVVDLAKRPRPAAQPR